MDTAFWTVFALLVAGAAIEWWLFRKGSPAYFRWGLQFYGAQIFPEDTLDPDEDDGPELSRRSRRLRDLVKHRWERADPGRRWTVLETEPDAFALQPSFPNPLLVRVRLEIVEGGVSVQGLLPWSFVAFPLLLVFGAELLPVGALIGAVVLVLVAAGFALREIDRLLYGGLEPLLATR